MSAHLRRPLLSCSLLVVVSLTMLAAATAQSNSNNEVHIGELTFTLAPGLVIEPATTPDLVHWPVVADWDAQGRLVVVESGGVARPIEEHNKLLLHRIVRLVDSDGDGRFDQRIVAADKLPFPEGVLCLGNTMLVSAPPVIWQLTDNDTDGVCEQRSIWFDAKTMTGCANDLHGPYLGRDGWVYWCKGAFAEQSRETADGTVVTDSAAHVYRRRFEGGAIEAVMSGGMDNPVELAITPEGERFFTSTFLQHPGNGLRDGIAHAIYGGVYGKDHGVIHDLPRTGPLMPIMTQLGPAAPSGLLYLEQNRLLLSDRSLLPKRTLVAALFNLQKVTVHRLLENGSSYTTHDVDLVKADRIDFHPTDVLEDYDGSLLIVDTGGWYDLCCPTSRVDQHTASGGIYRLKPSTAPSQAPKTDIPDWNTLPIEQCVESIHDSRPWVARMANWKLKEIAKADPANTAQANSAANLLAVQAGDRNSALDRRLRALWGLSWLETPPAFEQAVRLLDDPNPNIIHAACQLIAVQRVTAARSKLEDLLEHDQPSVRRAATEALGRVGNAGSIKKLMAILADDRLDRTLSHSAQYAVLELNDAETVGEYLTATSVPQRIAAMRLVDQLSEGALPNAVLMEAVASTSAELRRSGWEYLKTRPELIEPTLQLLNAQLTDKALKATGADVKETGAASWSEWTELFSAWRDDERIQVFVADRLLSNVDGGDESESGLESALTFADAWRDQPLPPALIAPFSQLLDNKPELVMSRLAGFDLRGGEAQPLVANMQKIVDACADAETQMRWTMSLPPTHGYQNPSLAAELCDRFSQGDATSAEAARLLERLQLDAVAANRLIASLSACNATTLMQAIELVNSVGDDQLDQRLLAELGRLPAARGLPSKFLASAYRSRSDALQKMAAATSEQLATPEEHIAAVVKQTLSNLPAGDPVRGLEVFRAAKGACAACHQMGYVGGNIGPELSRIGQSRTREALLEAILFPSSRIEQSYQPWRVLCNDGRIHNGLLVREDRDVIELQVAADLREIIRRDEIDEMRISEVSIMPSGMSELLSPQELADLLALLSP